MNSPEHESIPVYFSAKRAFAWGIFHAGSRKLTVLKGSSIAEWVASAIPDFYDVERTKLIDNGTIAPDQNGELRFVKDYTFSRPSAAACIIEGGSRNGLD